MAGQCATVAQITAVDFWECGQRSVVQGTPPRAGKGCATGLAMTCLALLQNSCTEFSQVCGEVGLVLR